MLSNTCNNTFLPQRKYSYGPIKIENVSRRKKIEYEKYDWFWDNRGRNIYLDKYLVSNFQVLQWQYKIGAQFDSITYEKWHLPSTSLSLEQMNKYCEYHNKRLMQAHFMDAASFIPSDEKNINPIKIFKKPYPWTRKKELFEIEQIPKYCGKIYSKECLAKDYNPYHDDSVTWMGLFSVLGGPLEAYNNLIVPDKNLKLSSYYFSLKNSIHEIGKRAYWDGQKQRAEHVFWDSHSYSPLEELKDNVEIGFRCYTEVY